MLLLYYIISFILEPSMIFSVLHNHVICDYDICDHFVTSVTFLSHFVTCITIIQDIILQALSKSKIKVKIKIRKRNKNK